VDEAFIWGVDGKTLMHAYIVALVACVIIAIAAIASAYHLDDNYILTRFIWMAATYSLASLPNFPLLSFSAVSHPRE
jgi:hypothetical protein